MTSFRSAVLLAVALSACDASSHQTTSTSSSTSSGSASTSTGMPQATPTIAFLDVSTGTPTPTTKMLWTNALDIRITGLTPNTAATVTARYTGWGATAIFTSDETGTVDLATQAPDSGSYDGVDPDGIVWSSLATTISMTGFSEVAAPPPHPTRNEASIQESKARLVVMSIASG